MMQPLELPQTYIYGLAPISMRATLDFQKNALVVGHFVKKVHYENRTLVHKTLGYFGNDRMLHQILL